MCFYTARSVNDNLRYLIRSKSFLPSVIFQIGADSDGRGNDGFCIEVYKGHDVIERLHNAKEVEAYLDRYYKSAYGV